MHGDLESATPVAIGKRPSDWLRCFLGFLSSSYKVDYTSGLYGGIVVSGTWNCTRAYVWGYGNATNTSYPLFTFNQTAIPNPIVSSSHSTGR